MPALGNGGPSQDRNLQQTRLNQHAQGTGNGSSTPELGTNSSPTQSVTRESRPATTELTHGDIIPLCHVEEASHQKLIPRPEQRLCACVLSHFSHVRLFVTPWTVAHQAPLSLGFSKQEY